MNKNGYREDQLLSLVQNITSSLLKSDSLEELLQSIVIGATELIGTSHAYIILLKPEEESVKFDNATGFFARFLGRSFPKYAGAGGKSHSTGEIIVINDYPNWEGRFPDPEFRVIQAIVSIPLKLNENFIGNMAVAYLEHGRTFVKKEIELLKTFAYLASLAINKFRIYESLQKSEEKLRQLTEEQKLILENIPVGVFFAKDHIVKWTNNRMAAMLGTTPEECRGSSIKEVFHSEEDFEQFTREVFDTLSKNNIFRSHLKVYKRDGSWLWCRLVGMSMGHSLKDKETIWIAEDITELKKYEKERQELQKISTNLVNVMDLNELFKSIVSSATALVDTKHGYFAYLDKAIEGKNEQSFNAASGIFSKYLNQRFDNYGVGGRAYCQGDIVVINDYQHYEYNVKPIAEENIHALAAVPIKVEEHVVGILGVAYTETDRIFTAHEIQLLKIFASFTSIALEKARFYKSMQEFAELSLTDPLTKVYNRSKFSENLILELKRAERYKNKLSIIMFDIDNFKLVNDTFGHDTGDKVLVSIADIVKNTIRNTDVFARWGGDEFIILTPGTTLDSAAFLAERIRVGIEEYTFPCDKKVTCSFGVAEFMEGDVPETLMKRADDALYLAKQSGRNCVRCV